ncbi:MULTISPECIES: N-acetylmuramoyl-L-alanine amidase [unclassified Lentimicrobium]|uniref:N-acetylmuramoyl-L-alanine amidase family protein n=1 Tax=unclassified Lentimicrobium TaxID=2677434 RepID=UPI001555362A|nr:MULTISPECIES: N-acetylmuramoyl-L-alanine amidase [unclassified Lentimicrobium]NPD45931.1 N-acetylmuramoyl-L-alanine amidase [Lentimicrobium sp. S6]NPD85940.1 N-acetylmuramoyl-L-alanine amidase [Lentimicrobium sp. L6]
MRFFSVILYILILSSIATAQIENKKVKAQPGDGIHTLLERNGIDSPEMQKAFIKLNEKKLKDNNYLIIGKEYLLPNAKQLSSSRSFDIFGSKYAQVKSKSQDLKGAVFYVVAGHGGPDPGAQGKRDGHTLSEDEYAYDISLRLVRELISHGATAYMITRDKDDGIRDLAYLPNDKEETIWKNQKIPYGSNKKLRQRARAVNKLYKTNKGKYQRMMVIHIDSRYKNQRVDIFGYYSSKSKSGKKFTSNLINTVEKKYKQHQPTRGFSGVAKSRDNLYMIKYTDPVTSFLELGNIQNSQDQIRFIKYQNRQAIADWLTAGCILDYKNSKQN